MKVLQLIDSLNTGGAERMAVTLANELIPHVEGSFLCTTREEGLLRGTLDDGVGYLFLRKRKTLDLKALRQLRRFVKEHGITVVHAHSSSFFLATLLTLTCRGIKVIWHDHYGQSEQLEKRKYKTLKWCSRYFTAIISVNTKLLNWAQNNLKCDRVFYMKNFVSRSGSEQPTISLKGNPGMRIVCLANLRPQKDHINLLKAYQQVKSKHPESTLHLLGMIWEDEYHSSVVRFIEDNTLEDVFLYGSQPGVLSLLADCNIGVLASKSEGLPVALLEYGLVGLPVVCTNVGQSAEVVGNKGKIVPPKDPESLAKAIQYYLENKEERMKDAGAFKDYVQNNYTFTSVSAQILTIYGLV